MRSRTRHSSARVWSPRRTAVAATRAGVAAVALVALMVGPPALLLHFVGNPIAGFEHFSATSPLTDVEVKGILALVIWLAWAQLVACILGETAAQIRGFTIPTSVRLPTRVPFTLGIQQKLARELVVAVLSFLSITPAVAAVTATGPATSPIVATARYDATAAAAVAGVGAEFASAADQGPASVVVRPGDDLTQLARTYLGSADRWLDIWQLNDGSPQPGGERFTDPSLIRPGWTLRMLATDGANASPSVAYTEVTVQPHDSMWSLALAHLGSGERWTAIWNANEGSLQRDGLRLTDPARIRPGWVLRIPAPATVAGPAHIAAVPAHTPPAAHPPAVGVPAPRTVPVGPADPRTGPPATAAAGSSTPAPQPSASTGSMTNGAASGQASGAAKPEYVAGNVTQANIEDEGSTEVDRLHRMGLGLSAVAAAAVVGAVGRRRVLQQRRRRAGRRIAMPGDLLQGAELELRVVEDAAAVSLLDRAARTLMLTCQRTGETVPQVAVVRLFNHGVELLLTESALAVEPFIAAGAGVWRFDAATAGHLLAADEEIAAADVAFPFPLLVTIGVDERGPVLVNLETAGALTVVGAAAATLPVLQAAATELATSVLSEMATVQLIGVGEQLAPNTEQGRATAHQELAGGLLEPGRFHADVTAQLSVSGFASMHEARTRGEAELTWPSHAVVYAGPLAGDTREQIIASGVATPGAGTGVIAAATTIEAALPGWVLRPAAQLRLELQPFGLTVHPQQLSPADLATITDLLAVSGDLRDVPAADSGWEPAATIITAVAVGRAVTPTEVRLRSADSAGATIASSDVEAATPMVRILGAVSVTGARGDAPVEKRAKATEIAAYLALHPNASRDQVTEAIWPDKRIATNYRQKVMSVLRGWLGTADDGEPYLGLYVLHRDVRFDWAEFEIRAKNGFAAGVDGLPELEAALALVRDRPFAGTRSGTYAWADALIQQDIMPAIRDVADAVATVRLAGGDPAGARAAAAVGLLVEPNSEVLLRHALRAAHARGDHRDVADIIARVDKIHDELDDNDPQTVELLAIVQLART
jgi:nucleoid-associated protein YgaU